MPADDFAALRAAGVTYSLTSPRLGTAPKLARDQVRSILRGLGLDHLTDTAVLLTSELVTNTYLHAHRGSSVHVACKDGLLRVTVYDGSDELPRRRKARRDDQCGRGLELVEMCADRWGVTALKGSEPWAKGVWFELGCRGGSPPEQGATIGV